MTGTKDIFPRDPARRRPDFAELITSAAIAILVGAVVFLIVRGVMWAV